MKLPCALVLAPLVVATPAQAASKSPSGATGISTPSGFAFNPDATAIAGTPYVAFAQGPGAHEEVWKANDFASGSDKVGGDLPRTTADVAAITNAAGVPYVASVQVSYLSTAPGAATLDVLKGSKRVARVTGKAKSGRNALTWNGKIGKKKPKAGNYLLKLLVTGGDRQIAKAQAKLKLKR